MLKPLKSVLNFFSSESLSTQENMLISSTSSNCDSPPSDLVSNSIITFYKKSHTPAIFVRGFKLYRYSCGQG
jgi:hypothetical protein